MDCRHRRAGMRGSYNSNAFVLITSYRKQILGKIPQKPIPQIPSTSYKDFIAVAKNPPPLTTRKAICYFSIPQAAGSVSCCSQEHPCYNRFEPRRTTSPTGSSPTNSVKLALRFTSKYRPSVHRSPSHAVLRERHVLAGRLKAA